MGQIINIIDNYFNLVKQARIERLSKEQFLNKIRKYIHEPAIYFAHFSDNLTIGVNNKSNLFDTIDITTEMDLLRLNDPIITKYLNLYDSENELY